jgi:hypothetical protein
MELGRRLTRNLAIQDLCCLAYHIHMIVRVALAPNRTLAQAALPQLFLMLGAAALTILLTRGEILPAGRLRGLVYRFGLLLSTILSYVPLRYALPALGNPLLDPQLLAIDVWLFHDTPARWLERFVTPQTVEWFAFFYYSYFTLVFGHMFGSALFDRYDRGRRAAELLFAALTICCLGQTLYTLVPGAGPYAVIAFGKPLSGGFFYQLVWTAVSSAGALLDIFPSLHTAYPTLITLHAWRYRHTLPYRYSLAPTAFFAVNIVIATLFLRWHYAIDVVFGVALAATAQQLGILVANREHEALRDDRQPVWEPLWQRPQAVGN